MLALSCSLMVSFAAVAFASSFSQAEIPAPVAPSFDSYFQSEDYNYDKYYQKQDRKAPGYTPSPPVFKNVPQSFKPHYEPPVAPVANFGYDKPVVYDESTYKINPVVTETPKYDGNYDYSKYDSGYGKSVVNDYPPKVQPVAEIDDDEIAVPGYGSGPIYKSSTPAKFNVGYGKSVTPQPFFKAPAPKVAYTTKSYEGNYGYGKAQKFQTTTTTRPTVYVRYEQPQVKRQYAVPSLKPVSPKCYNKPTAGSSTDWPMMAYIVERKAYSNECEYLCAATLVSNNALVAAAHCFDNKPTNGKHYAIRFGDKDSREYPVASIVKHPKYVEGQTYDDIAVVRLGCEAPHYAVPICLPSADDKIDQRLAYVLEWTPKQNAYGPKTLKLSSQRALTSTNEECCRIYYRGYSAALYRGLDEDQLCTDLRAPQLSCQSYASGSPMILVDQHHNWYLAGISSFRQCDVPNAPGVFTRVNEYSDWIQRMCNVW